MKKQGLLSRLEEVRLRSEGPCDDDLKKINQFEVLMLLLEYMNDSQISDAVQEIPF